MLSPLWHSGKGKALQVLKRSGIARSLVEEFGGMRGERGMNKWVPGVFRVLKLSIQHYNGGQMAWCICQNPQNCTTGRVMPNINYGAYLIIIM